MQTQKYTLATLNNVFSVGRFLGSRRQGVSFDSIVRGAGVSKTQADFVLSTLLSRGSVVRELSAQPSPSGRRVYLYKAAPVEKTQPEEELEFLNAQ